MRVFKFGGASVKDAAGVKNVVDVLQQVGCQDIFLVVSAMGKMTNAFEKVTDAYFYNNNELPMLIDGVKEYHYRIAQDLFEDKKHTIFSEMELLFDSLNIFITQNQSKNYSFVYDQLVSFAELFSTKIVSFYLNETGLENTWLDVRDFIITNSDYRDAKVDWQLTEQKVFTNINIKNLNITQGFLAKSVDGYTTTLGREGSDYTAAIFAYCLNAESVTIWKDVKGVLNADPRYFKETQLLEQISYTEAIELAFYGASVIHPKTLQPL